MSCQSVAPVTSSLCSCHQGTSLIIRMPSFRLKGKHFYGYLYLYFWKGEMCSTCNCSLLALAQNWLSICLCCFFTKIWNYSIVGFFRKTSKWVVLLFVYFTLDAILKYSGPFIPSLRLFWTNLLVCFNVLAPMSLCTHPNP